MLIFIIFLVLSAVISKDKEFTTFIGLMIIGSRGIELEKILKCLCILQVIVVYLTLLGCGLHVTSRCYL